MKSENSWKPLAAGLGMVAAHCAFWGWKARQVHPELRSPLMLLQPTNGLIAGIPKLLPEPQRNYFMQTPVAPGVETLDITPPPSGSSAALTSFLYLPENRVGDGAVVWIPGGGHVVSSAKTYQDYASQMAVDLGVPVLAVEYRLAGEAPFPADIEDCWTALRWFQEHAADYGVNPAKIALAGASAGAGLAAVVAQKALDEGHPVNFQALIYPMLDDRTVLRSEHRGRGRYIWTPLDNKIAWNRYLEGKAGAEHLPDYASAARRENLTGLPGTWIGVGSIDLFFEEDVEYHERLLAAGVHSEMVVVPGMFHGSDTIHSKANVIQTFYQQFIAALRDSFAQE